MNKPRIRVNQKGAVTALDGIALTDGMANVITGLGRANMKSAATRYVVEFDSLERDNAYRASTWYRKIVNIPAADAVREWRSWQAEKDQIEKIEAEEKRLGVRNAVYQALLTARHTGGAVIMVGGLPGVTSQPLRMDSIRAGTVKYLTVLGRDDITPGAIIRDPQSDWFGQPEKWTLTTEGGMLDIHPSRVVFVNGRTVPGSLRRAGEVWGDSIWTQMADSIRSADNVAGVIDALLHEAKIDVVRIKDMVSQMASGASENDYITRWTMVATLKSISNVLMLDGDDEWSQKQITWAGLPDIARTLLTIMAGAADIPVTRLTGEQQAGLSSADSGSLKHYYDSLKSMQELEYTPALQPLDEMLIRSALGERDPAIWYSWNSLWQASDKERAEVDKLEAEAVDIYARSGLIPQDALAGMVQTRLIESESWPGADTAYTASKADLDLSPLDEGDNPSAITADAAPRTLYVRRDVLNAKEIIAHFKAQGFTTTLPADDMHVTIAFSRQPVDWMKVGESWQSELKVAAGGPRMMDAFGPNGEAKVLLFASSELSWRYQEIKNAGASWDHTEFQPHITISYAKDAPDLTGIEPWQGEIVLGPEIFAEVKEDWKAGVTEDAL
ncbi:DUF1073 domain-containing protein [Falsochrobactrum sp. TDYN1]|uniref:Anti-CBASS protein Acb1 n=1 Tax=Falsochrobactrum tianjinense TaxID=2706015 RepID=A0A949PMZ1_9HYPH|nr:anti-CBASS Acb1 family protein [Falsochrobactrum sp. TDYN1]MBV2144232.1 DUF1073 domain-containing protein [Falsochrobactrum sp. TDYN1]